jgi:hypothetical protein
MEGAQGDLRHPADRPDPGRIPVIVNEGDPDWNRGSSLAWAKYVLVLRRISLA